MPTMRAARWHAARDIRIEDVELVHATPGEVLVEVERVGICGSDVEEYLHGPVEIPSALLNGVTLGHEIVGRVVECPSGEVAIGSRVIPDVVVGCGRCRWCHRHEPGLCPYLVVLGLQADGGLADFVRADARNCVLVPDAVSPDVAVFAEPLSVAIRAVRKAGDLSGATVAVVGLGSIGTLALRVAVLHGAGRVVGVDPVASRREMAITWGASVAVGPGDAVEQIGSAADVVLECAGTSRAMAQAFSLAGRGATIVAVGIGAATMTVPIRDVILTEQRLLGTAAHVWDVDVQAAVSLLERALVDPRPLIGEVIGLAELVPRGFAHILDDPTFGKVLVDPHR